MREFKFRAWQGETQTMIQNIEGSHRLVLHLGEDELELMQYTGLKDKNDKEIYEGDILASTNHDPEYDIWEKDELGFTTVYWSDRYDGWRGSKWQWGKDDESSYGLPFVEIIGNIYENPELFKEEQS